MMCCKRFELIVEEMGAGEVQCITSQVDTALDLAEKFDIWSKYSINRTPFKKRYYAHHSSLLQSLFKKVWRSRNTEKQVRNQT